MVVICIMIILWNLNLHMGTFGVKIKVEIKIILVSPKDKDEMVNKNSVIYIYCCWEIDCDEEYIGESGRTFGERFKEHLKNPSPIFTHQNTSGHITSINNFKIIGKKRTVWQEPYKKPCLSGLTTQPWTKTLENTISHIYGIEYYSLSQN